MMLRVQLQNCGIIYHVEDNIRCGNDFQRHGKDAKTQFKTKDWERIQLNRCTSTTLSNLMGTQWIWTVNLKQHNTEPKCYKSNCTAGSCKLTKFDLFSKQCNEFITCRTYYIWHAHPSTMYNLRVYQNCVVLAVSCNRDLMLIVSADRT